MLNTYLFLVIYIFILFALINLETFLQDLIIPSDLFVIGTCIEGFESRLILTFGCEENLVVCITYLFSIIY